MRLAEWCRTVIPRDRFVSPHQASVIIDYFACIPFQYVLLLVTFKCEKLTNMLTSERSSFAAVMLYSVLRLQLYIMKCRRQELPFCNFLLNKCFERVGEVLRDNWDWNLCFYETISRWNFTFPGIMETNCAWIICTTPGWDNMNEIRISIPYERPRIAVFGMQEKCINLDRKIVIE